MQLQLLVTNFVVISNPVCWKQAKTLFTVHTFTTFIIHIPLNWLSSLQGSLVTCCPWCVRASPW